MKSKEVTKIRDLVATHKVVPDEPFPTQTADTIEQFIPVTDSQGYVQLVGKRIVPDELSAKWKTYDDNFVQAMGLFVPQVPHSAFTTIENFKEAAASHVQPSNINE